jgi:endonuclease G
VIISEELIAQSESRLTFDPEKLSEQLNDQRPIVNEAPDRIRTRLAVAEQQGPDALERIIGLNDLMGINYLERGTDAARAIGRIHKRDASSGDLLDYATGFLISPHLLLTNNHVFGSREEALRSQIEFNYQRDKNGNLLGTEIYSLLPDKFFFTSKQLDFAIVAVEDIARASKKPLVSFGWLTLNPQVGKVSPGEWLTIIQHPSGDDKQIGLRENKLLKIQSDTVWYTTDTTPGSSGSPVFNDVWQVIALHHSGVPARDDDGNYLTIDGQIWKGPAEDSKIKWIANEGIRVSRIVETVQAAYGSHELIRGIFDTSFLKSAPDVHRETHPQEKLVPPTSNLTYRTLTAGPTSYGNNAAKNENPPNSEGANGTSVAVGSDKGTIRVTVPLTITVQVDGTAGISVGVEGVRNDLESLGIEAVRVKQDYSDRKGYDSDFLGTGSTSIPLPQLSRKMERDAAINTKAKAGVDEHVLPYHHFSVVMNKKRKLAFFTAVNIDGRISRRLQREKDKWILDPRIGSEDQTDDSLYAKNDLDRGHLVRRLDPVWGDSEAIAKAANDDTFHFTNCSPQHADFNQNDATWQGLENYILDNAIAEDFRVSVFTGPVFRDDDRLYREVKLPKQFWKVLAMVNEGTGKLSATAYLLSQSELLQDIPEEAFSNDSAVKHFQVSVRTIEGLTGLSFGNLSAFDPMDRVEGANAVTSIASFTDIRF